MMHIETIETESLGNRGYLAYDDSVAIAIDVQRDYQRWSQAAAAAGVKITLVLETHMHNDYVTGGYQLAKTADATYAVPQSSGASFAARELGDAETIEIGTLKVTGYHTPGHTEHHMSYHIADKNKHAIFTGGGLLYGTVGRTDLVSAEKTEQLTGKQYDSAQRLATELAGDAALFPTHGFGSFCSSASGSAVNESTLATEQSSNIVFTTERQEFVQQIISGLGPYPRYYAHIGSINQTGPEEVQQLHIHEFAAEDIAARLTNTTSWVIDTRSRTLFAANHPEGAVGIELGTSFATYTGWIVPWSERLLLVGETQKELREAYTELSRIGMDSFVDGATETAQPYFDAAAISEYKVVNFKDLKSAMTAKPYVLDVRLASEWRESHIPGSHNIPLHEVISRVDETPQDQDIWVHCASGYRASIAASLLDKHKRQPVLIDDSFQTALELGIAIA